MPKSHYDTGFPNEVTVKDIPALNMQTWDSRAFWVDYEKGSNSNKGNVKYPFKTLNHAIEQCEANNGDQIYVSPNHAETIADATSLVASVAGIQIFGLGNGNSRPTFSFSATSAAFVIDADDVYISNILFKPTTLGVDTFVDVNAARLVLNDCHFITGEGNNHTKDYIWVEGSSNNACDGLRLIGCEFYSDNIGTETAVHFYRTIKDVYIINCVGSGYFGDAIIYNPLSGSDKDVENIIINGGIYENTAPNKHAITLSQDLAGIITKNTEIRADISDDSPYSTQKITRGESGTYFTFTNVVTASQIKTIGHFLSDNAIGELFIESVVVEVSNTPMATATNIQLRKSSSTYGSIVFWEETVANLTANKSIDLFHASVAATQAVLEDGEQIEIKATGADATGGDLKVTIVFKMLADGALINKI